MSTEKHSPAPWRVAPDFGGEHGQFSILDAEGCEVGSAEAWIGNDRAEATANAHLIAAAPDLLAALKLFRGRLLPYTSGTDEAIRKADAAIAKAEALPTPAEDAE